MSGIRVVRKQELSIDTAQTPGMERRAAITAETTGTKGLWVGAVTMAPGARSGAHHHGDSESVVYLTAGLAQFRWGERLEHSAQVGAGDFVYIPSQLVHQEINMRHTGPLECIVIRTQGNIVVNVEMPDASDPGL